MNAHDEENEDEENEDPHAAPATADRHTSLRRQHDGILFGWAAETPARNGVDSSSSSPSLAVSAVGVFYL